MFCVFQGIIAILLIFQMNNTTGDELLIHQGKTVEDSLFPLGLEAKVFTWYLLNTNHRDWLGRAREVIPKGISVEHIGGRGLSWFA